MRQLSENLDRFVGEEPERLLEASLHEFLIPEDEINSKYGITQETNWSNPSIVPNKFDQNWNNWFKRISTWGKVNILHVDPEHKIREFVSQNKFISLMGTSDMLKLYGKFVVQQVKINKMEFQRHYVGIDGKEYKEIFQIKVDLHKDLQKGLGFWQRFS